MSHTSRHVRLLILAAWDRCAAAGRAVEADPKSTSAHDAWFQADVQLCRVTGLSSSFAVSKGWAS